MPIIKQAAKKMRRDKKRAIHNFKTRKELRTQIKQVRTNPSKKTLQKSTSIIDKSVKRGIIHKNKASRLKSRLSKLLVKK